ncbi:MAG: hypothetical protein ACK5X0_16890 [Rhodospirillales bacterium]
MSVDIRAVLKDPAKAILFTEQFLDGYLSPAFGTRSKGEIDILVFTALINSGAIVPASPVYDLARTLNISPARARSLVFNWQLRNPNFRQDLTGAI